MLKRVGYLFFLTLLVAVMVRLPVSRPAILPTTRSLSVTRLFDVLRQTITRSRAKRWWDTWSLATVPPACCTTPDNATLEASYRVTGAASQAIELEVVLEKSYPTWIGTYDDTGEVYHHGQAPRVAGGHLW